jgi:hypothetical protein
MDGLLASVIKSLSSHIAFLRRRGWKEPAHLLEIAKLDLQARARNISDRELRVLCVALGARKARASTATLKRLLDATHSPDTAANRRPFSRAVPLTVPHVRRSRGVRREAR